MIESHPLRNQEEEECEEEEVENHSPQRRSLCKDRCKRPINVCICKHLPSHPFLTTTQILILHHPHESRHSLSTTPLLPLCLQRCQTLIGRRLRPSSSKLLQSLPKSFYLFPSIDPSLPSISLPDFISSRKAQHQEGDEGLVLIAFDGTWKHAKEMVRASREFLGKFAVQVCLGFDAQVEGGSIFNNELVLRKEPFGGCMSTIEAVARALRFIEPNGVAIEECLLGVLRAMVRFQALYLKPIKPRPRMGSKGKGREKKRNTKEGHT